MNKILTLLIAGVASQVVATDLNLGAAMGVSNPVGHSKSVVGLALTAEHESPVSEMASYFASANVFVSPMSFQESGPKNANIVVGGTFATVGSPVAAQLGLGVEVISPATAEASVIVAPSIFAGAKFTVSDEYSLTSKIMHTMPVSAKGEIESASSVVTTASVGIQKTVSIDV